MTIRFAFRASVTFVVAGVLLVLASAAGNVARGQSTASLATSQTLLPAADAYVDASSPSTKYGGATTLRVDAAPSVQRSYLRFSLASVSGTVTQATLRLYPNSSQSAGYDVYSVSDNTWTETGITYSNAPALASSKTGSSGRVTAGTWATADVTSLASAGHTFSVALTTTSGTALSMSSKEGANPPQLVVQTAASSDTQAPTTPTGLAANPISSTEVDLSWSPSTDNVGVTGYSVYRDGGSTPLATVSGSTLAYPDKAVSAGSTHTYTVDAFDAAGNHSAKSAPPVSATTPEAPGCTTSTGPNSAYSVKVCLTAPASGTVSGAVTMSATASTTGSPPAVRLRFCLDDSGCDTGATGYVLSDFQSNQGVYSASLPTANWVDGAHALTARAWMGDGFLSQPTPAVNLTFQNGVTQPPANGNTFTPTSGTTPNGNQPLVVAAVGDGAGGETNGTNVVNLIAGWNPNLVLYLGDVYEKGSPTEFFNYYGNGSTLFNRFRSITDPTIGNHEYSYGAQASGYFNFWDTNRHYYSFDAGGWHFISLDSTSQFGQTAPGSGQYQWLQGDLAADTAPCTLVFYHHPLYNVGPELPTTRMSDIWSLLVSHGGVLVVNGHDHDYQRYTPLDWSGNPNANGVTEIVAGAGGHGLQQAVTSDSRLVFSDFAHFGALKLQLGATSASFSYISTDGVARDSGTIPCNPPPTAAPPAPSLTLSTTDGNDSVSGSTVFYNPGASGGGAFTVTATSGGASSVQFPAVFGSDGATDTVTPFSQTYTWASGASPLQGPFGVTASNAGGTSAPSQFTVTPDSLPPSTAMLCNGAACSSSPYSSAVSVSLVRSDAGSGGQSTYYTLDGSDPTTSGTRILYTSPFLRSSTATVSFYSLDKVGNAETPQSVTVTISTAGGIAFVQQQKASGIALTLPVTLSSASGAGDALVAVVALAAGSSASVSSVSDSAGGSWTKGPVGFLTGTNSRVEIWYQLGAPSVTSLTVTLSAAKSAAVNVSEWSGVGAALDQPGKGVGASSSTSAATPVLATTNATDLVIGAINYPASATSTLDAGPFTSLSDFSSSPGATSVHGRAAFLVSSATGSYQASWTLSAASGGSGGAIIALKAV